MGESSIFTISLLIHPLTVKRVVWTARAPLWKGWSIPLCQHCVCCDLSLFPSPSFSLIHYITGLLSLSLNSTFFWYICHSLVTCWWINRQVYFWIQMVLQRSWLGLWYLWVGIFCLWSEGGRCVGGYEDAVKTLGSGLCLLSGSVVSVLDVLMCACWAKMYLLSPLTNKKKYTSVVKFLSINLH